MRHLSLTKLTLTHHRRFSSLRHRNLPLPPPPPPAPTEPPPQQPLNYNQTDFSTLCRILSDPTLRPGPCLEAALDRTGIEPASDLLHAVFDRFDASPKLLHALFLWAEKKPGFRTSAALFNLTVNALGRVKEFDSAWCLILDCIRKPDDSIVSIATFATLVRRYTRAGMPEAAIRAFEYASGLEMIKSVNDNGTKLFEILLDSLCKEGHVRVAKEFFDRKLVSGLEPSVRIYNILLNGWLRARKLKQAERLWSEMRDANVLPTVVTYGTMVEGYCRMRKVEKAIELVHEMRRGGVEPNAVVYNPIIDALAEDGRFKEVSSMMERFLQCESGPTISTYNSLVKGYCKTGDLIGGSKILKMMVSRGILPAATTYNYFFKYFSKRGKTEEGMNLYNKIIELGYSPNRLTFHLLLKMLCEEGRLDLAVQVSTEMRARGFDTDLATGTMLTHLLCNMRRFEEALAEFQDMLRRGIVPQYLTFQKLNDELRNHAMTEMAQKLCEMMASVPHATNLPNTYNLDADKSRYARRKSILRKAEAMSEILKTSNNPRELVKLRSRSKTPVSSANRLIEDIKRRSKAN